MKRKLTFLMLFMAFFSMISLGQNQGPDWGEDYSSQFGDATTTYTVSISINGVLQEHTDLEIAPYYDGKRYGFPVRLTQAPDFLGGKYDKSFVCLLGKYLSLTYGANCIGKYGERTWFRK